MLCTRVSPEISHRSTLMSMSSAWRAHTGNNKGVLNKRLLTNDESGASGPATSLKQRPRRTTALPTNEPQKLRQRPDRLQLSFFRSPDQAEGAWQSYTRLSMSPTHTVIASILLLLVCGSLSAQPIKKPSVQPSSAPQVSVAPIWPVLGLVVRRGVTMTAAWLAAAGDRTDARGCLAGGVSLPISGPISEVMRFPYPQIGSSPAP